MNTYRVHAYNPTTDKISVTQVDRHDADDAIKMVMSSHMPYFKLLKVECLNEHKNWDIVLQVVITPVDKRVETGPLKVNDDWCGYFLRGDNAVALYTDAVDIEEWFWKLPEDHRSGIWIQMTNLIASLKDTSSCKNK